MSGFFKDAKSQTSYGVSYKLNVVQDLDLPYTAKKNKPIVKNMKKDLVTVIFDGIDKVTFKVRKMIN